MQRKNTWLIANWKMHGTHAKARAFAYEVNAALAMAPAHIHGVFCPPFPSPEPARAALPLNARLAIGGQNCARDDSGAFTGGISAPMLKDCGARYVILGHSERRQLMFESDNQVEAKVEAACRNGLTPIICVGETEAEYTNGETLAVLERQCAPLKKWVKAETLIAYEPVWAIGTGKTPTGDEIRAAHNHIKSILGSAVAVLYGGSVKPSNIGEILSIPGVHGALIGGASLEVESMVSMLRAAGER